MDDIVRTAVISPCGNYRYLLTRIWDERLPLLVFIMLNPSVADAEIDDPTIRRCMWFAKREGYGGIVVANLYAFRATSPRDLFKAKSPFGPDNEATLRDIATAYPKIVCAWGSHGAAMATASINGLLRHGGAQLVCLGRTKDGHPRHPLYVPGNQPLEPFDHRPEPF